MAAAFGKNAPIIYHRKERDAQKGPSEVGIYVRCISGSVISGSWRYQPLKGHTLLGTEKASGIHPPLAHSRRLKKASLVCLEGDDCLSL